MEKEKRKPKKVTPLADPPEIYIRLAELLGPEYWVGNIGSAPVVYRDFGNGVDAAITVVKEYGGGIFNVTAHIWRGFEIVESSDKLPQRVKVGELRRWLERMYQKYGKEKRDD